MALDEHENTIDMSRCEQLLGKKHQLYGCGLCVAWILDQARKQPDIGLRDLLRKLDEAMDEKGLSAMILEDSIAWKALVELQGFACRPRRYEVGQALTRLRCISMEELAVEDDDAEAAAQAEAERKRQVLLELWNARRMNKLADN